MNLDDGEFEWLQLESRPRVYRLARNEDELATLKFEKCSGSLATAKFGLKEWTFKRTGFLSPKVSIREVGSETDLAIFSPSWSGGGSLTFLSGQRYRLRQTNFWGTEWAFETEDGSPAVVLSGPHGGFKQSGEIRVAQSAASTPETPLLILLIWYLRVLMSDDAVVATLIATT
jgi:hypothetical protein